MLGDDLIAVIVFGSVLKSKNLNDVEVLVITKNLQKHIEKIRGIRLKYRKEVGRFIDLNIISPENFDKPIVYTAVAFGEILYFSSEWNALKSKIKQVAKERNLEYIEKEGKRVKRWKLAEVIG